MDKKPYSILMPPPNLTGELHLGHAMQHVIMDAIARFKRLQGYDVLFLPGVDHAGIQFEGTLNKELEKEGLSKNLLGREKWLERAWKFKDKIYKSFHKTWNIFGISADWSREVFTLDEKVQRAVFAEFKRFWDDGLLYKGAYIVQWCPKCQTAIEDLEMEYEKRKEKLYFVKYQIANEDEYITVATARPETIFADAAIAVYPNHPKYQKFVGKQAINPLNDRSLPIFEDKRVDKNFGTGALKITPGHDPLDFEIGKDYHLEILHAVDKTGRMTDLTGEFAGLDAQNARKPVAEKLKKLGKLEKEQDYLHTVPVCERCKTTVEPLISEEWFVRMKPLALKAIANIDQIKFYPAHYKKVLVEWMKNIHDWSISRSLWWGIRIPFWYCKNCNPAKQADKSKYTIVSFKKPKKLCEGCKKSNWVQDEQVLDTWFSSGIWPLATLGWPRKTKDFKRYYPWDFELSAPEIKFLWIARMIMLGLYLADKIPFKNMFFHGMLKDLKGRKFSKSLGNGIEPRELIEKWGVDATRMALYSYSAAGRGARTSREIMDERCKNFRNFETKIRNIARFIIDLAPKQANKSKNKRKTTFLHKDDKAIKAKLDKTEKEVTRHIDRFQLHLATQKLYNFIWHEFADDYLEKSKKRRSEAQPCLNFILERSLQLLSPFMPFLTAELQKKLIHHLDS